MITGHQLQDWLAAANARYSSEGMRHAIRPFQALSDYTFENSCSLSSDHPIAKVIFEWFYAHSPPGAHHVGSIYEGVFYYDTAFWSVAVPMIFGTVSVNAWDCLTTMPEPLRKQLSLSSDEASSYAEHWFNCMDYGHGYGDVKEFSQLKPETVGLLAAADGEIRAAVSQLLQTRPNLKALLSLRMAVEIFLKVVLVEKLGLAEKALRTISHDIGEAAKVCGEGTGIGDFLVIRSRAHLFPSISSRYCRPESSACVVWEAMALAQFAAASATRCLGGRDTRQKLRW